jgi:hypothetical protein
MKLDTGFRRYDVKRFFQGKSLILGETDFELKILMVHAEYPGIEMGICFSKSETI